jgi:hypothetical protein
VKYVVNTTKGKRGKRERMTLIVVENIKNLEEECA